MVVQRPEKRPDDLVEQKHHDRNKTHVCRTAIELIIVGLLIILTIAYPTIWEALFFYTLAGLFAPIGIIIYFIMADMWWPRNRR